MGNNCVAENYDCGCCGGPTHKGQYCLTSIPFDISNLNTVDEDCGLGTNYDEIQLEIDGTDYTGACIERTDVVVPPGVGTGQVQSHLKPVQDQSVLCDVCRCVPSVLVTMKRPCRSVP